MLNVDHVDVRYGGIQALWDVTLTVEKGEFLVILGSNGAGKTTLLRTISGLLRPSSGSITFLGTRIDTVPPYSIAQLGISQVPEGRMLFPWMNVIENLLMGAVTVKSREREKERIKFVYKLFPILEKRKSQMASTLSGGEQQMLAIGRSLMSDPKLLILDELSLGLAPNLATELLNLLKSIRETEGTTIVITEQNVRLALELADRSYLLENGRVTMEGEAAKLLDDERVKNRYLGI